VPLPYFCFSGLRMRSTSLKSSKVSPSKLRGHPHSRTSSRHNTYNNSRSNRKPSNTHNPLNNRGRPNRLTNSNRNRSGPNRLSRNNRSRSGLSRLSRNNRKQQRAQQTKPQQPKQERAQQTKPQQPKQERSQQTKPQQPKQERAQQTKPQQPKQERAQQTHQQPQGHATQQQARQTEQPQQGHPSRPQAVAWQQQKGWLKQGGGWQGHSTWAQNGDRNWDRDHRTWAQRGGYGGYYISENTYNLSFGSGHWFRMHRRPEIYMGYPRFSYGGFWFMLVDPWPGTWAENWYTNDDVYIEFDDGYYLCNRTYPGIRLAVTVSL